MKYSEWEVRPIGGNIYEVYRVETGGIFPDKEEAEHIAYELNKEGKEEK